MIFTDKNLIYLQDKCALDYTTEGEVPYPQVLVTTQKGQIVLFEIEKGFNLSSLLLFIRILPGSPLNYPEGTMLDLDMDQPRVRFSKCRFPTKFELEFYERFSLL